MSEKKRKRTSEKVDRASKKLAVAAPPVVKVSAIPESDEWAPVIASTPGLSLPPNISFKPYRKTRHNAPIRPSRTGNTSLNASELLLHSSTHPKINYTGREEEAGGTDSLLKHYVGVYDPTTGELQVMQARNLVLRGSLRESAVSATADVVEDEDKEPAPKLSSRAALGLSFGTKKSQKAIRALTENAIAPRKPPTTNGTSSPLSSSQPLDPLAAAVVESMASTTSTMPTREELQSAVDDAKPRPKPNLQATTPAEVYPVSDLVGGEETLRALGVKDWEDAVAANEPVHTKSRFVSKRLVKVTQSGDVKMLKTLRYLLLLLDFYGCLKPGARGVKKIPQKEELRKAMSNASDSMIEGIRRRFGDNNLLNKWHTDNLLTHIFALALTIDNFDLDIYDLREDLKLENKEITTYLQELGAKTSLPTETERTKWNMTKAQAAAHRMARLRLPLEFPKVRRMGGAGRGR